MKFASFLTTFLAVVSVAVADVSTDSNPAQVSLNDTATPAPTTYAPTAAPTESAVQDVVTPCPTTFAPTAAPTKGAVFETPLSTPVPADESAASQTAQQSVGAVGVAYSTTRAEYDAQENSGSSATLPIAVAGCVAGVIAAVAAAVVIKKRKAAESAIEEDVDVCHAIETPTASA